ncbi:MAG TPA: hypothetical protein VFE32_17420 [Puia sp.]|jgi:hypothetical protein|nr:hypothetical protein [Puia sp.]
MTPIKSGPRSLSLKNVPDDVFELLVHEQTRIKLEKRTGKFGIEQVVYKLLRALNKISGMKRRPYDHDHMCYFARYVLQRCKASETLSIYGSGSESISLQTLNSLLHEWKRDHPNEYEEEKSMVIGIGKTPADVLGLKGPKNEPPSAS